MHKKYIQNRFRLTFTALLATILLATSNRADGQSPAFSQFFNNPLHYNPAYTGSELGLKSRMHFRNQFGALSDNYDNIAFSMDLSERNIPGSGGFGFVLLSDFDGIGLIRTTSVRLTYSARIQVSDNIITQFGVGPSFVNRRIDWSRLIFSDQIDPYGIQQNSSAFIPAEENSLNYPDFGFGFIVQFHGASSRFFNVISTFGGSVDHAIRPDISFSGTRHRMPLKITLSGNVLFDNSVRSGLRFEVDRSQFRINPGFIVEMHNTINTLSVGVNAYKNHIYTGVWSRVQQFQNVTVSDLIFLVGIEVPISEEANVKLMYSYDYLLNGMMRTTGATHEISAVFSLDNFSLFGHPAPRRRDVKPLECPSF